ncbi:MAG: dTDP-4-dehydrorhamnose 3,5-epimerase [Candidatus Acidiferrales bacterium]|jgi:dTDP-4-dehydrorhamnose 3,5-epimerase
MMFLETKISGVFEIRPELAHDERGFFGRSWCQEEFASHGLNSRLVQCNISGNLRKGTLRGMHYQAAPFAETKLVRCTRGSIFDVALDLRPDSPTYKEWTAAVLTAGNHHMLCISEGCAHGFLTLEDDCEIFYQMSEFYHREMSRGVRWNDPAFGIKWPGRTEVISTRDASYPDFA